MGASRSIGHVLAANDDDNDDHDECLEIWFVASLFIPNVSAYLVHVRYPKPLWVFLRMEHKYTGSIYELFVPFLR
jgi:hypothetical protein